MAHLMSMCRMQILEKTESNWLPAPTPLVSDTFKLILRMYLPQSQILNGTWSYPTLQRMG
jgi:hypothetical protein